MTRLKLWRQQHSLTQQVAADRLGIGESTLALLESGRLQPTSTQMTILESTFGCDALSLFEPVRDRVEALK